MSRRLWAVGLIWLGGAAVALAAPVEQLLGRVPDDAAFCLVVNDLRGHLRAIESSPWLARLADSRVGRQVLAAAEARQLHTLDQFLTRTLGLGARALCDDVLGDAVVLAYRLGPSGSPDGDQGLLLLWARDADKLAALVGKLKQLQQAAGDIQESTPLTHAGQTYERLHKRNGSDEFLLVQGPLLALSGREAMIRTVIERGQAVEVARGGVLAQRLRDLKLERALAVWWLNPRAFDGELAAKAESDKSAEATFAAGLLAIWKAIDGVALALTPGRDLELSLAIQARPEALPEPAARLLAASLGRSAVWDRVPDDALLALGGRLPTRAWFELFGTFLTDDARRQMRQTLDQSLSFLGRDRLPDVLAALGPDWGGWAFSPTDAPERAWLPAWVVGLRLGDSSSPATLGPALVDGLNTLALLAVLNHNRGHEDQYRLHTVRRDGHDLRYLENDRRLPAGYRPAFGLRDGYLVVASSPEAWHRFGTARAAGAEESSERMLLWLSVTRLRTHLKNRAPALVETLTADAREQSARATELVTRLLDTLELLDRVELTAQGGSGQARLTLRLVPAAPLSGSGAGR